MGAQMPLAKRMHVVFLSSAKKLRFRAKTLQIFNINGFTPGSSTGQRNTYWHDMSALSLEADIAIPNMESAGPKPRASNL
jgi:hypothetical protein